MNQPALAGNFAAAMMSIGLIAVNLELSKPNA